MADRRAAQPVEAPPAPVPGAMAVLALTAFLVSLALGIARVAGMAIPVLWILAPMWGSALAVALYALAHALPQAAADARAWVRRRGQ